MQIESLDPILVPPSVGFRMIGASRSAGYRLLAAGRIKAVKAGAATKLVHASLVEYTESLPAAQFRSPAKVAA